MLDQAKTDLYLSVMQGIYRAESMRIMARNVFKSLRSVQNLCEELEKEGYVHNPYLATGKRKYHNRTLTPKGETLLRSSGLLKGP
jgi:Mn-dependent DtxR family transcriptional regulator